MLSSSEPTHSSLEEDRDPPTNYCPLTLMPVLPAARMFRVFSRYFPLGMDSLCSQKSSSVDVSANMDVNMGRVLI